MMSAAAKISSQFLLFQKVHSNRSNTLGLQKELKTVDTDTRDTVFGFTRQIETYTKLFGNAFSNLYPSEIQFIVLLYYWNPRSNWTQESYDWELNLESVANAIDTKQKIVERMWMAADHKKVNKLDCDKSLSLLIYLLFAACTINTLPKLPSIKLLQPLTQSICDDIKLMINAQNAPDDPNNNYITKHDFQANISTYLKTIAQKRKKSRELDLFEDNRWIRILMVGLNNAGKTTILKMAKLGEIENSTPITGFNVETVEYEYKNILFTAFDMGKHVNGKSRQLWEQWYQNTKGIIFVVDSNDRERINESMAELHVMLTHDKLRDAPLLVLANKQDLPNAMSLNEVTERLLLNILRNRQWYIQSTSAITGDGLLEGLNWLKKNLKSCV